MSSNNHFSTINENHLIILKALKKCTSSEKCKQILLNMILTAQVFECSLDSEEYYYLTKDKEGKMLFNISWKELKKIFKPKNISSTEINTLVKSIKEVFTKELVLANDQDTLILFKEFRITVDGIEGEIDREFIHLLNNSSCNRHKEFYDSRVGQYSKQTLNAAIIKDFTINELLLLIIVFFRFKVKKNCSIWGLVKKYILFDSTGKDSVKVSNLKRILKSLNKKLVDSEGTEIVFDVTYNSKKEVSSLIATWSKSIREE